MTCAVANLPAPVGPTHPPTLHGPYIQWTRTAAGKMVGRHRNPGQPARYQPWSDDARRLEHLVAKLEIASLHAVRQAEKPPRGRERRPRR